MKTIYKYPLPGPTTVLEMPKRAKILHVHTQEGVPTLWALVDTESYQTEKRTFIWIGTGLQFNLYDGEYIGTVHAAPFVWHIHEVQS